MAVLVTKPESFGLNQSDEELPYTKGYRLHHLNLRINSNNSDVLELIHQVLYPFQIPAGEQYLPHLNFRLKALTDTCLPSTDFTSQMQLVSFDENQKFYCTDDNQIYSVSSDRFIVYCNLNTLEAMATIGSNWPEYRMLFFHQVFYPILAEMLKKLHVFNIHTAAVCRDGIGILFPAQAQSGKSTLTLSMLKAGFGFLSDDICFLKKDSRGLLLLGFAEPIKIWDKTIELFPELSFLYEQQNCKVFKKSLPVEQVFPHSIHRQAIPKVIVLPQIISSPRSTLQPISKTDTLVELIPQSLLVTNKHIVKHHLEILTNLVDKCQCYRLLAGQDILEIPKLIEDVL
jgi:hypothetical protein